MVDESLEDDASTLPISITYSDFFSTKLLTVAELRVWEGVVGTVEFLNRKKW